MRLFLLENDASVDDVVGSGSYSEGEDVTVCLSYLAYLRLQQKGGAHRYHFVEELLSPTDYACLHSALDEFSTTWFMRDGEDLTLFSGVSFGEAAAGTFSRNYMLSVLVKYGEVMRLAKERWPALHTVADDFTNDHNSFFYYEDDYKRIFDKLRLVETVGGQLGLSVRHLGCRRPTPSVLVARRDPQDARAAPKGFRQRLKRLAARVMRGGALGASHLAEALDGSGTAQGRCYFSFYSNLSSVAGVGAARLVMSTDAFIHLRWHALWLLANGARFADFDAPTTDAIPGEQEFIGRLQSAFLGSSFAARSAAVFALNGIDYSVLFLAALNDLITSVFPALLRYSARLHKGLRKWNILSMILNEEVSEFQKTAVRVCRRTGTRSVFLNHGFAGHRHALSAFDRGESDVVLCPGGFFEGYYREQAKRDRAYEVLGSPALDPYPASRRKSVRSVERVMILTFEDNFYARLDRFSWHEAYYAEILPVIPKLLAAGIEVHYRPHFENRAFHRHLFVEFGIDEGALHYDTGGAFESVVRRMDLVVSNVSTCFYEALAAGVPTVFFEPHFNASAILPPMGSRDTREVLRITTGTELWALIERNRHDASELNRFVDAFLAEHASAYTGPLDGKSGERVARYLRAAGLRGEQALAP